MTAIEVHVEQTAYQGCHLQGQDFSPCTRTATGNQIGVDPKFKRKCMGSSGYFYHKQRVTWSSWPSPIITQIQIFKEIYLQKQ
jgi:hypothetical protein